METWWVAQSLCNMHLHVCAGDEKWSTTAMSSAGQSGRPGIGIGTCLGILPKQSIRKGKWTMSALSYSISQLILIFSHFLGQCCCSQSMLRQNWSSRWWPSPFPGSSSLFFHLFQLAHVLPTEENFLLLFRCQQLKSCEEFMKVKMICPVRKILKVN